MKTCFKCDRRLPLSEFYRHPMMGDGHLGKCKACTKRDVRENYWKRRDYYLEYEQRPERKATRPAQVERSRERHPLRHEARRAVAVALRTGRLVRQPCEVCGALSSEGHHPDYSKPLDVLWLCRKHHSERHRLDREGSAA